MKILFALWAINLLFTPIAAAKKINCEKYKTKLNSIQSKQRQANTVKRSNTLKEQELKMFKKWRKCKQGKLK